MLAFLPPGKCASPARKIFGSCIQRGRTTYKIVKNLFYSLEHDGKFGFGLN